MGCMCVCDSPEHIYYELVMSPLLTHLSFTPPPPLHPEQAPISSSAFMSGSAQTSNNARAPIPGPAYYLPSEPSKQRSYHLNAVQRWMPS